MNKAVGKLTIGEEIDAENSERSGTPLVIDSDDLTTHGVIVGMTGSGKTGLGVVLLEEALLSGIPVLAIDPKGDLGNLCLTFPELQTQDFGPWVDHTKAQADGISSEEIAEKTAKSWTDGLASWDLDGSDVATLQQAASPVIYTPGSDAGIPLDVLGRLAKPTTDDSTAIQEEVDATVAGLLDLVGVKSDSLSGREHILLANLVSRAWTSGDDLDMPTLLNQIIDPPIRKLGVLELDAFFPAKDRQKLAMRFNGLLASPSFAAWSQGAALDIPSMLWDNDGKARAAVVSVNHLEETERHFAITLVLSKLISWMRTQPGTGGLRALVYIDEVMGLAPPTGNPSTKKPILTLLKQARAFGVGLVLSTQNPVDLDYKAISNSGTWMIGRLQTEQDKNRLVDGLKAADGSVDLKSLSTTISGLDKRQFVLRTTRSSKMPLFTTRWALSYLAGPMTRKQISGLMSDHRAALPAHAAGSTEQSAPDPAATDLGDGESTTAPDWPDTISVAYTSASAPWLETVGGSPTGTRLLPALAARVTMLFDETKAELRHSTEWEAIIPVTDDIIDVDAAVPVDFDDRDFTTHKPAEATYVLGHNDVTAAELRKAQTALKNRLYTEQTLTLQRNVKLKLWSRPTETAEEFATRCDEAAQEKADEASQKIRTRLEKKNATVQTALSKAQDRAYQLQVEAQGRKESQIVNVASGVLGSLLGGRSRVRSMASAARRASSGRRQAASARTRQENAQNRVAEKAEQLEDLEAELAEALIEIDDEWASIATEIEDTEIALEKTDITITDITAIWYPSAETKGG